MEAAVATGELERYDEYTFRKPADVQHVSHGDFIAAKLRVERGGERSRSSR